LTPKSCGLCHRPTSNIALAFEPWACPFVFCTACRMSCPHSIGFVRANFPRIVALNSFFVISVLFRVFRYAHACLPWLFLSCFLSWHLNRSSRWSFSIEGVTMKACLSCSLCRLPMSCYEHRSARGLRLGSSSAQRTACGTVAGCDA
jgi:hypothetical protein